LKNQIVELLDVDNLAFPPLKNAVETPNGLLAFGGDLSLARLQSAYRSGIFPWYGDGEQIMWWSPDPRGIILTDQLRINRTLRKTLKQQNFTVTLNQAFDRVINYCADAPFREEETWIIDEMIHAYQNLHNHGIAHSIEVWMDGELAGGLYGVAINGYFSGESMFYRKNNGSKIALVYLNELLKSQNISLIDCQMLNPFLEDMGCVEVPRSLYMDYQAKALSVLLPPDFWLPRQLTLKS
jgi:leucyl/phenylalanyl-tRNA--protein transferase